MKRIFTLLVAIIMAASFALPVCAATVTAINEQKQVVNENVSDNPMPEQTKASKTYYVSSFNDILNINNDLHGTYILTRNINCNGAAMAPIGAASGTVKTFYGTILGCGYTISNLTVFGTNTNVGFIAINYGTVKDLRLSGIRVHGFKTTVGVLVGCNYGKILNCDVYSCNAYSSYTETTTISDGSEATGTFVGGLCGYNSGTIQFATVQSSTIGKFTNASSLTVYTSYSGYVSGGVAFNSGKITGLLVHNNTVGFADAVLSSGQLNYVSGLCSMNSRYGQIIHSMNRNNRIKGSSGTSTICGTNYGAMTYVTSYNNTNLADYSDEIYYNYGRLLVVCEESSTYATSYTGLYYFPNYAFKGTMLRPVLGRVYYLYDSNDYVALNNEFFHMYTLNIYDATGAACSDATVVIHTSSTIPHPNSHVSDAIVATASNTTPGEYVYRGKATSKDLYVQVYRDTAVSHKRGTARKQFEYTDHTGKKKDNVEYVVREHAYVQNTTTGTWSLPVLTKYGAYYMNRVQIRVNLVVGYYYKNGDDYFDELYDIMLMLDKYMQDSSNGYFALNEFALFGTTHKVRFNSIARKVAGADIKIVDITGEWSRATVDGFHYNLPLTRKITMSAKPDEAKYDDGTYGYSVWKKQDQYARTIMHELGHYLYGLKDEYLNGNGDEWSTTNNPKPTGAPSNHGLMENQHSGEVELSMRSTYQYYRNLTESERKKDRNKTRQYKYAVDEEDMYVDSNGVRTELGSCWEHFAVNYSERVNDNLDTSGRLYIAPTDKILRGTYTNTVTKVWMLKSAGAVKSTTKDGIEICYVDDYPAKNDEPETPSDNLRESDTLLAHVGFDPMYNSPTEQYALNIEMQSDVTPTVYVETEDGVFKQIEVEEYDEYMHFYYGYLEDTFNDINSATIYVVAGDEYSLYTYELINTEDPNYTAEKADGEDIASGGDLADTRADFILNPGVEGKFVVIKQHGKFELKGELAEYSDPVISDLIYVGFIRVSSDDASGKVSAVINDAASYNTRSIHWNGLQYGDTFYVDTLSEPYDKNGTAYFADIYESAFYFMTGTGGDPENTVDAPTDLTVKTVDESDGMVDVTFTESNSSTVTHYVLYYSRVKFDGSMLDSVDSMIYESSDVQLPEAGAEYYFAIQAIASDGAKSEVTEIVTAVTGLRKIEGSDMPVSYIDENNLWLPEDTATEVIDIIGIDNMDADGDGISNIDEYNDGTNPASTDTDGDGVDDMTELLNETDPTDETDGSQGETYDLAAGDSVVTLDDDKYAITVNIANLGKATASDITVDFIVSETEKQSLLVDVDGESSNIIVFTCDSLPETYTVVIDPDSQSADTDFTNNSADYVSPNEVTFVDAQENVVETQFVYDGGNATLPEYAYVQGFIFTGWDNDGVSITKDTVIHGLYVTELAFVDFETGDGFIPNGFEIVSSDENASAFEGSTYAKSTNGTLSVDFYVPENGYLVWFGGIQTDIEAETEGSYSVFAVVDDTRTLIHTENGDGMWNYMKFDVSEYAGKLVTFEFVAENDNATVFLDRISVGSEKTEYTVTFVDGLTSENISVQTVHYGESAEAPSPVMHEGYTFTGWDNDGMNIAADITITALYEINTYTVTFVDNDGTVLATQEIEHGGDAQAPTAPTREGYTFTGWD
ncbi:MAG: InlB B-repeat-containing protein, partial [Clostridia bacterium]|nr:InlB B-repeat-containing protein [Clostridia bacterium]